MNEHLISITQALVGFGQEELWLGVLRPGVGRGQPLLLAQARDASDHLQAPREGSPCHGPLIPSLCAGWDGRGREGHWETSSQGMGAEKHLCVPRSSWGVGFSTGISLGSSTEGTGDRPGGGGAISDVACGLHYTALPCSPRLMLRG